MNSYGKPLPNIDEENEAFWNGLKEHNFLLMRCKKCGAWYWPAAYCRFHENEPFMGNMEWVRSSGKGKIFAYNIHNRAFHPGFQNDIPYVYALIELEEGPMFATMIIDVKPDEVRHGAPVQVVYEDIEAGFTLPKFTLVR